MPSLRRHLALAGLLLALAPGHSRADEAALDAALRAGGAIPREPDPSPRERAALAAIALGEDRLDEARELLPEAEAFGDDCAFRALRHRLGLGSGCASLPAAPLPPRASGRPVRSALLAPRAAESGSAFPAAVLAATLEALSPEGDVRVEISPDSFRVAASSSIEGLWYLDDRLLVVAFAEPGSAGVGDALRAMERLLALRPSVAGSPAAGSPAPAPTKAAGSHRDAASAMGLELELPAGWRSVDAPGHAWAPPESAGSESFPSTAGGLALLPERPAPGLQRGRNPLARRRRAPGAPPSGVLPPGASPSGEASPADRDGLRAIEWTTRDGASRRSLVRSLSADGHRLLAVAHLGSELSEAAARELLLGLREPRH